MLKQNKPNRHLRANGGKDFWLFFGTSGLALLLSLTTVRVSAAQGNKPAPPDHQLKPEWLTSLTARGLPETYSGKDLRFIGMPVGGIGTGTLYLGGDGRLWLWGIFNRDVEGVVPRTITYKGAQINATGGASYVEPPEQQGPVQQGFALRWHVAKGGKATRTLDRASFKDVTFLGQYPIGTVTYRDPDSPLSVRLEAYSPFIPLNPDDSSLPATVLSFTLKNDSQTPVTAELIGWLENAVCLHHRLHPAVRRNQIVRGDGLTFLNCSAERPREPVRPKQPDLLFEDWRADTYQGWTVEGTAFGKGPIKRSTIPAYQGDVGGDGERVVNSHATAPGDSVTTKDAATGKLTSKAFAIERDFIRFWIGGGAHAGQTCVNLVVGGKVVRTATGRDSNRMHLETFDVRPFRGQQGVIQIVDAAKGPWGNVGVGRITFTDAPVASGELEELDDYGTMGLALLGAPADLAGADSGWAGAITIPARHDVFVPLDQKLQGALTRKLLLQPGQTATVHFVVTWHFPNYTLAGLGKVGRHYAARFDSARDVAQYVSDHFTRLSTQTHLWRDTWNDSTLPHWFLNRTFANTSTLATATCYRFKDGRFWAWEGVGSCHGTCTHVWHYAQAMAHLFPQIERDQRERVDFGLALDPKTGVIWFRGEYAKAFALDGQAGTILRAYREHQMAPNDAYLKRVWPGVKKALQCLLDRDGNDDGIIEGPVHNTLDADWYGVVPWLNGLYHAALRAGEEMAEEVGDIAFARRCRKVFDTGVAKLDRLCWNEKYGYYVHRGDPKHPNVVGVYDGCHIDQVMGQGWAHLVNLGEVMVEDHVQKALHSLWKYNFQPDVGPFREAHKPGRWYALPGEAGLVMATFPHGQPKTFGGEGAWSAMYFNECMSGFEYQVAGHMLWEGMVTEGLAVTRAIHDRYSARRRNPYNEIECSDHYARAMASYGVYLAACGFAYHGPKGHIAFAPRLTPDNFRVAFTAAEGWGTFHQKRDKKHMTAVLEVRWGKLRLRQLALALPPGVNVKEVTVFADGRAIEPKLNGEQRLFRIMFAKDVRLSAGQRLKVELVWRTSKGGD